MAKSIITTRVIARFSNLLEELWESSLSLTTVEIKDQNLKTWRKVLKRETYTGLGGKFTGLDCIKDTGDSLIFDHECGKVVLRGKW